MLGVVVCPYEIIMDKIFSARITSVPGRYALALFKYAYENKIEVSLLDDLILLRELIGRNPRVLIVLKAIKIASKVVDDFIENFCKHFNNSHIIKSLIYTLSESKRITILTAVINFFEECCAEMQHKKQVIITSSEKLSKYEQAEIEEKCLDLIGKSIAFSYSNDPKLIGGFVVNVGSREIDASVRGYLARLTCHIREVQT